MRDGRTFSLCSERVLDVKFKLDNSKVPDGTILVFGVRYRSENMAPAAREKVWTYAMLKAGGFWYVTGTGRVPVAAGWGAVERWLDADNREVVSVALASGRTQLWPSPEPNAG